MIHQSDHDRAGYHRYFFDANWDSSLDYDLVVNTSGVSPEEACETVSALLRSPRYVEGGDRARGALLNLRVAQDVIIAVAYRERVAVMSLDAVSDKGVVTLTGTVRSQSVIQQCMGVAGTVKGVAEVVSKLEVVEYAYYPGVWPS